MDPLMGAEFARRLNCKDLKKTEIINMYSQIRRVFIIFDSDLKYTP